QVVKDSVRIGNSLVRVFKWKYCVRSLDLSEQTTGESTTVSKVRLGNSKCLLFFQSSELEDWVEDSEGWEGEADEGDLDAVLREKRQYERERRREEQLRRKAERDAARTNKLATSKIATKIS
ncbi:uncharacterized protein LOC119569107, partial [Penaeus monodon]|uniref:uncharacterized protein LOC119569107 n=1 Tax=Penaeus monodon TaxID=6687 RepID=UPI0018A744F6